MKRKYTKLSPKSSSLLRTASATDADNERINEHINERAENSDGTRDTGPVAAGRSSKVKSNCKFKNVKVIHFRNFGIIT